MQLDLNQISNKIIAVDFDNTLTYKSEYPITGKINPKMIKFIKDLQLRNNKIILWTCREDEELVEAIKLCAEYKLYFDAINANVDGIHTSRKVFAHYYIDDKAIALYDILGGNKNV